jgi:hypothetical protein
LLAFPTPTQHHIHVEGDHGTRRDSPLRDRIRLAGSDVGVHALVLCPDPDQPVVTDAGAPAVAAVSILDVTLAVAVPGATAVAQLIRIGLVEGLFGVVGDVVVLIVHQLIQIDLV